MAENINKDIKRERFKRLAAYRTTQVLKRLQVLSNCANRSAYEYSEDEINKIFSTIDRATKNARSKFHYSKEKINFKF